MVLCNYVAVLGTNVEVLDVVVSRAFVYLCGIERDFRYYSVVGIGWWL